MKIVAAVIMCVLSGLTVAQSMAEQPYSPGVGRDFPRNVYWGDTHLHTRNSADAYTSKNNNLSPDDAYRFARGEEITAHTGIPARLRRALDFLVVADHASYLGAYYRFDNGDPMVVNTEVGKRWSEFKDIVQWFTEFTGSVYEPDIYTPLPEKVKHSIWLEEVVEVADRNNAPGIFTAFTGYEWTSMIDGNNLHRVVIFKDGADKTSQTTPFSANDSVDPEALWRALEQYESDTGGEAFAIAHNGNLSNGVMFANDTVSGKPLDKDYATRRARWEPLYEVTQVKGDGEAHPILSPNDEFADYETWDTGNIAMSAPKEDQMLQHEYARGALKLGLKFESQLGANPFKFGMIGSTDSHTSLATAAEDNFFGKFPESEPSPERLSGKMVGVLWENWKITASGYAGIWARENTRAALFEAMKRRETYATTGSRMVVRFFGGWEYQASDLVQPDYVEIGYARGVPMGGDLTNAPNNKAPVFIAAAAKDPDGANLDRIQIVKGWLDGEGDVQETIYTVALSDGRKENQRTGKVPAVGSTVDVNNASYTNAIGDPYLSGIWEDPNFDPKERAFYYVRVIEIPTPRWSTYDAKFFNVDLADEIPMLNQDRAYTSPIWYTP
jgi:hypothetical protein